MKVKLEANLMRVEIFSFTGNDGNRVDMVTYFYSDVGAVSGFRDERNKPFGKLVAGLDIVSARSNNADLFKWISSTTKFPARCVLIFEQEARQRNQVLILLDVQPVQAK